MNIKTKFKLGDTVYAIVENMTCCECGSKLPTQATERVEFKIKRILFILTDHQSLNIRYSDSRGLYGWFNECDLKRVR